MATPPASGPAFRCLYDVGDFDHVRLLGQEVLTHAI
jgi:hypothetical protein